MTAVESAEHGPESGRPQDFADPRRIEWLPLDQLIADPANPKDHAHDLIDDSIRRHGVIDLITRDDRTGYIVSGHGRTTTLRAQRDRGEPPPEGVQVTTDGTWLIPVTTGWSSTDDLDARAALIGLNRTSEAGGWVDDSLLTLLDQLSAADALAGVGYTEEEIEALRTRLAAAEDRPAFTDPDEAPPLPGSDPVSVAGDLWLLGPHRLLVGDACTPETYEALLSGDLARCVWTDPPYGVSYVGQTKDNLTIQNDDLAGLLTLLTGALTLAAEHTEAGGAWYVAYADKNGSVLPFLTVLHDLGIYRQNIAWVKDSMVLGHGDYHSRYEPVAYGWKPGVARLTPVADRTQTTVWEIPRPKRSEEHPTMKPVELVARALRNSTGPGDLVLDPFAGSGTTLIAAHQEGRRARLVELDPRYADVICRRYQEHTGVVPVRDGVPVDFTAPVEAASSTLAG